MNKHLVQQRLGEVRQELFRCLLQSGALSFPPGGRRLKSGRTSPYFFNSGDLGNGRGLHLLGEAYAYRLLGWIQDTGQNPCELVLYGPTYKGIPLATATSVALFRITGELSLPVVFNRKELKDHGEGGILIGAETLEGKQAIVIDDVITAGTAKLEAAGIIQEYGGKVGCIAVILDRQEKGVESDLSAVQQVELALQVPVFSLFTLQELLGYLREDRRQSVNVHLIEEYQQLNGV